LIVVDASASVLGLLNDGEARALLANGAVAEELGVALVTADGRLARAPGPRCTITVVPR
jgi:hypothetical protein